ncbi:MAG: hypothetical protein CM15mP45_09990 [Deltaproteobacteria bacterium]|nr:MAG: hypothetical protein CM15mP45_09990 [Deltaproteobacteria bacterium]
MDRTLGPGKTRGIQDQHPPRPSDPGSFGCLGCDQYRLFDEICSGGPGIDGFDVLAGLVRTAGPVLAQRRIELGHLAGHWFGFLWYLITANPGVEGLNLWVLLILVPAVGMSLQNTMMTRYTGLGESPWKWSAFNELGILVSSCLLWFSLERTFVDLESAWLYLLIPAFLLPAVYFVSYAFLNGRASVIAPLGYVQLPTAALYGWLVFEETPENKTYYGALLIILAGLILIRFAPKSKYP